jgi:hypothetical protein
MYVVSESGAKARVGEHDLFSLKLLRIEGRQSGPWSSERDVAVAVSLAARRGSRLLALGLGL